MKPKQPRVVRIPENVLKRLQAMGRIKTAVNSSSRYTRHQGPRECARRVRQMQKTTST